MMDDIPTILIVDDSDVVRHSLTSFFTEYDFEVITCRDGLDGIQKAVDFKPKLVFLDLIMPHMGGLKALQVFKTIEELKKIPVIVITASTSKENVLTALKWGAERVLSKPLTKLKLVKCIKEILGEKSLSKAKKHIMNGNKPNQEVTAHMKKFFINGFPFKKSSILDSLKNKNAELLNTVVHEIRGEGGVIGLPELTKISAEIENKLKDEKIDWNVIESRCYDIINIVNNLRN